MFENIKEKVKQAYQGIKKKILWFFIGGIAFAGVVTGIPQDFFNEIGIKTYTVCDISTDRVLSIVDDLENLKARNPDNSLRAINANEKASIKGCEIAKIKTVPRQNVQFSNADYDIEIVDMKPISGGVEIFARAWSPDGTQIGFGKDGTVDIERFVFINPPILVSDSNGDIIRESFDKITNTTSIDKFREDLLEATLQTLVHTISVKKQKFGNENIIVGKIGNTTLTVYPAAGSNTPVDGVVQRGGVNEIFTTLKNGAGNFARESETNEWAILVATTITNQFSQLSHLFSGFDTSSIGSDGIDSATLSLASTGTKSTSLGDTDLDIISASPASENTLVNADYGNIGTTRFATGIAISAWSNTSGTYNDFTLNSDGENYINKSGNTFFSMAMKWDVDNNFTGTWASGAIGGAKHFLADEAGTTKDPKLVVEHSSVADDGTVIIIGDFY